jgi:hypothetical protein
MLERAPDDVTLVDVSGHGRWERTPGSTVWRHRGGVYKLRAFGLLRQLGDVTEVVCRFKDAYSCRVCRRWLEGEWSSAGPAERVEIQRQMDAGHCDDCHRRVCLEA